MKNFTIGVDGQGLFQESPLGHIKATISLYRAAVQLGRELNFIFYTYPPQKSITEVIGSHPNCTMKVLDPWGSSIINYQSLWQELCLPLALMQNRVSLLHCTCNRLPRFVPCPSISTIYDLQPLHDNCSPSTYEKCFRHYGRVLRGSKVIITCSNYSKQEIVSLYGSEYSDKIQVVPLAVPALLKSKEITKTSPIASTTRRKYILGLGNNNHPRKNIRHLIACHLELQEDAGLNYDWELILCGMNQVSQDEICSTYSKHPKFDSLKMLDYVEETELSDLYKNAQAFVYPSLYEGFGLPILEAMSLGCPVIAANTTSIPEVSGDAAILVEPTDKIELKGALLSLRNQDFISELRLKGQKNVARFSWENSAHKLLSLYEKVLLS
jgi:glycosyltransferase involved in cell wall biosynthesis